MSADKVTRRMNLHFISYIYIVVQSINQSINQSVYSFIKHCSVQLWQIHEQDEQGSRGVLMAAKTSYLIICIW